MKYRAVFGIRWLMHWPIGYQNQARRITYYHSELTWPPLLGVNCSGPVVTVERQSSYVAGAGEREDGT